MKKILAATAAALALAAAVPLVATAHDDDRGGRERGGGHDAGHGMRGHHGEGHHGGGHGHGGRGARLHFQEMIETYDADGDGSVSQAEVDEWRASRLREFDADGDGQLSLDEYQALWLDAMRERMVDQFQEHDDDGDGQVTVEEFGERTSRMVMMRDRNEDDVLNAEDAGHRGRGDGPRHGHGTGGMPGSTTPGAGPAPAGSPGASDGGADPETQSQPPAPVQQ
jgi:Ca2+-binding EF-hand superfamily protein